MAQLTRQDTFQAVATFVCAFQALFIRFIGRYLMFTFEEGYLRLLLLCLLFLQRFNIYMEENDAFCKYGTPVTCRDSPLSSATTGVMMLETMY